jgi:hypothetical protein
MDPDLGRFTTVWAAAGTQNAVFEVAPGTLRMLANAIVAPIAEEPPPAEAPPGEAPPSGEAPTASASSGA